MNLIKSFLFRSKVHVPKSIKYASQLNKVLFWEQAVFVDSVHMFRRKTFLWSTYVLPHTLHVNCDVSFKNNY